MLSIVKWSTPAELDGDRAEQEQHEVLQAW